MAQPHFNLDMQAARPLPSRWRLLVLVAAALVASLAADRWLDAQARRDEARDVLARLQQAQQRQTRALQPAASTRAAAADARVHADLVRIAADLHRPWWPLLDAVEQGLGPSVQVLQLGVDTGFTKVQLQVQARSLPDVLQLVQTLDAGPPPLRGAQLVGHEWVGGGDAAAGAAGTPAVPRLVVARLALALGKAGAP